MTRFVYVARPIDQAGYDTRASSWASRALGKLSLAGVGAFAPERAFHVPEGAKPSGYIEKVNRAALAESDGLLVILPSGVPSIGVPMEIEFAIGRGLPVAVITDVTKSSWSLQRDGIEVFSPDQAEDAAQFLVLAVPVPHEREVLPFARTQGPMFGQLPARAHEDDAGLDLFVSERTVILPGRFQDVPCSVAVGMEFFHWGLIIGRSSTLRKRGLMVNPGIIDPGYRGELYAGCFNLSRDDVTLEPGERVAQFILMDNATQRVVPRMVDKLSETPRGTNGFGSSGT